jgi:spore maturation protein CgeB
VSPPLDIVILGLSITSSWGNGHATTYRGLVRELIASGHQVLFLERDARWYADNRDLPNPPYGVTELYADYDDLRARFHEAVANADVVIVGSYVPDGIRIGRWVTAIASGVTAFYDIDTPVTLAKLEQGDFSYLAPDQVARYHLYLSFTGGPMLQRLEREYGARCARPLYCGVDQEAYYPEERELRWDLGYMGTYSHDRQASLDCLLNEPARRWLTGRFVVAGPQYPGHIVWPTNVRRIDHLTPSEHRGFFAAQRYTLNLTRGAMVRAGYSPSVRLFEAAACGVPMISDYWDGLDSFFKIGVEILVARSPDEVLEYLRNVDEPERREIGRRARARVLAEHTAAHRAQELESHVCELLGTTRAA